MVHFKTLFIYAILSQNFVFSIYALFRRFFETEKQNMQAFFAFRMCGFDIWDGASVFGMVFRDLGWCFRMTKLIFIFQLFLACICLCGGERG